MLSTEDELEIEVFEELETFADELETDVFEELEFFIDELETGVFEELETFTDELDTDVFEELKMVLDELMPCSSSLLGLVLLLLQAIKLRTILVIEAIPKMRLNMCSPYINLYGKYNHIARKGEMILYKNNNEFQFITNGIKTVHFIESLVNFRFSMKWSYRGVLLLYFVY